MPCRLALQDFQDVTRTNKFWGDVQLVAARGIMVGYNDLTFGSNAGLLRGAAAVALVNTFNLPESLPHDGSHTFADVDNTHWAYKAVETLVANDATSGCNETHFCPNNNVTRAELATFLVRAYQIDPETRWPIPYYVDVSSNDWYFPFVQIATERGWMSNCTKATETGYPFCPNDPVERILAAHIIGAVLDDFDEQMWSQWNQRWW